MEYSRSPAVLLCVILIGCWMVYSSISVPTARVKKWNKQLGLKWSRRLMWGQRTGSVYKLSKTLCEYLNDRVTGSSLIYSFISSIMHAILMCSSFFKAESYAGESHLLSNCTSVKLKESQIRLDLLVVRPDQNPAFIWSPTSNGLGFWIYFGVKSLFKSDWHSFLLLFFPHSNVSKSKGQCIEATAMRLVVWFISYI